MLEVDLEVLEVEVDLEVEDVEVLDVEIDVEEVEVVVPPEEIRGLIAIKLMVQRVDAATPFHIILTKLGGIIRSSSDCPTLPFAPLVLALWF